MTTWFLAFVLGLVGGSAPHEPSAGPDFFLKGGERVVFFGDSITQSGAYITDVEAFLLTRFPDREFTVINHGISSETISGTSEPDHDPRRPDAHDRFDRDVTAWNPDVVVACFGMNDGNYFPFEPVRFGRYQAGVQRLIDRVRDEARARLVLMTPPPFDPYRRQVGDPKATEYGYRFAALDYDRTLARYSDWLLTLRSARMPVADLHSALNAILERRRDGEVSFFLAGDGVHPGPTGHWLMAQTLLETWNAPALVSEAVLAAGESPRAVRGALSALGREAGGAITFHWHTPLPAPIDQACDAKVLVLAETSRRLNRHQLQIEGLPAGSYRILARVDASQPLTEVGTATAEALGAGLDLTTLAEFPTVKQAASLRARLARRNQARYDAWRKAIGRGGEAVAPEQDAAETAAIRALARPVDIEVRVEPLR